MHVNKVGNSHLGTRSGHYEHSYIISLTTLKFSYKGNPCMTFIEKQINLCIDLKVEIVSFVMLIYSHLSWWNNEMLWFLNRKMERSLKIILYFITMIRKLYFSKIIEILFLWSTYVLYKILPYHLFGKIHSNLLRRRETILVRFPNACVERK